MVERSDDEGPVARWSRRKQAARQGQVQREEAAKPPATEPATRPEPEAGRTETPAEPAESTPNLPDPELLDATSDFRPYLGRDVPVETHRAALRRLWRLNPIYNRIDGLDDYCEDYTDKAMVVKGLKTAYRVGRGMIEKVEELAANQAQPDAPEADSDQKDEASEQVAGQDPPERS